MVCLILFHLSYNSSTAGIVSGKAVEMIFEMLFDVLKPRAIFLDKYYNLTRYPNYLPGGTPGDVFDDLEAERAIELAQEVVRFVEERITEG